MGVTVLAEKIVGAAAEAGRPLAEVAGLCARVNAEGRSMGMALTSCIVPAAGKPTFELGDDEMEIGIGIHGEPGRERVTLASAHEVVAMLADPILDDLPFASGDNVLAFVNGMGGTPQIELYIVYNELRMLLAERGVNVTRSLVGLVHHLAGDGRVLDHAPAPRRRAHAPVGRAGAHRRPALGRMSDAGSPDGQTITAAEVARWIRDFAGGGGRAQGRADQARPGDRRRRSRHQHGSRDDGRRGRARRGGAGRRPGPGEGGRR